MACRICLEVLLCSLGADQLCICNSARVGALLTALGTCRASRQACLVTVNVRCAFIGWCLLHRALCLSVTLGWCYCSYTRPVSSSGLVCRRCLAWAVLSQSPGVLRASAGLLSGLRGSGELQYLWRCACCRTRVVYVPIRLFANMVHFALRNCVPLVAQYS